jgi:ABC-type transport system involved in cytochrome bd biosynthesis fused ATPase/permease subunit
MEELLNIWNADDELNEDELMNYVKGKSSEGEKREVEKQMASYSFVNDAVQGLQNFSSTEKINAYVQQANQELHKYLQEKKSARKKTVTNLSWQIIGVIIIILLCILGYVIIEMMRK